jgi:hypothetical protein
MRRGSATPRSRGRYEARVARQRVAAKGPGEDSEGGVTIRQGWETTFRNLTKSWQGRPARPALGYGPRPTQVLGGITHTQWLTTLTGESPTSSRPTQVVGRVKRVDKAQPKRRVEAAARGDPTRIASSWGRQLSRCSGDDRDRETQRKETSRRRTMRIVIRPRCHALTWRPGPLSDSRTADKKHSPRRGGQ